jgi:hypothetical protein
MLLKPWAAALLLGLCLCAAAPVHAAIKLIVLVGTPRFDGSDVSVPLTLYPFGGDARAVTVSGARTALVASTSCAAIKTLIIARVASEYSVTLTAEEIMISGCPQ